ncbi:MAG: hypothetical protein WC546_00050 [Candidatus Omnitrophota bacterium]
MAKKRSIGVTIFGWWYAVGGVFGLLGIPVILAMRALPFPPYNNPFFVKQFMGTLYVLYSFVVSSASITAGIGIIKLKPWARKLVIILCATGILYSIYFAIIMLTHSSEFVEMSLSSSTLPKGTSSETLGTMKAFMQIMLCCSAIVGMFFGIAFIIFIIWFFMRKSVVEQFQPVNKINSTAEQIK